MAGSKKCESLFSLEVVVESVDNICISCYKPAIAFRLLDFPTVVIRSERQGLLTKETSHEIQSGKSCLFKMSKDVLCERLKTTPLYIMLVDTCSAKTKLLASTAISLLNCFQNILANIENNGLDIPAVSGSKGEFSVYNLMGSQVATLKLGYRMFSFGLSMSGHVNLSLPKRLQQTETIVTEISTQKPENLKASGQLEPPLLQHRAKNSNTPQKELFIPDGAEENYISLADAHTQTEKTRKHSLTVNKNDSPMSYGTHHYNNIFRPPPLYYNSMSAPITPQIQAVCSEQKHSDNGLTKPRLISASLEKPLKDCNVKINSQLQYCDASIQACEMSHTTQRHNTSASHVDGHKMGLPLIEALLNELSFVRSIYGSNDLPRHLNEGTTTQYKNKKVVNIHEKSHVHLNKQQDKQTTKPKKCVLSGPKKSVTTRTNSKGVLISRYPIKFKKSSLKYGTTKTQKLREAFSKRNTNEKHDVRPEAGKDEYFLSEQNEEKCLRQVDNLEITSVVEQKSKQDLKDNKSTMTQDNELGCKDIGIQVRISDDRCPGSMLEHQTKGSPLNGDGSNNAILGATYINNVVPFIATNQVDDNADELFGGNFSSAKELEGHSSKPKLLSNYPSEFPTFSNVSPTVPVARNTRCSNNEESSEASQNKSRSLDSTLESRLSDKSLGLVSKPVGEMQSNSNSSKKVQKKRSSSSEKSIGEVHSKSDSSGNHDLPGKYFSSGGKASDERLGLVNKPIDETHSYCDVSLVEESTRDTRVSLGSRLSNESLSSVCKSVGEYRSNGKRSSKESMQDKSICSDSRLSDKSLDLVNKPVDQLLSMSGYSDDFESDASDDEKGSLAS